MQMPSILCNYGKGCLHFPNGCSQGLQIDCVKQTSGFRSKQRVNPLVDGIHGHRMRAQSVGHVIPCANLLPTGHQLICTAALVQVQRTPRTERCRRRSRKNSRNPAPTTPAFRDRIEKSRLDVVVNQSRLMQPFDRAAQRPPTRKVA